MKSIIIISLLLLYKLEWCSGKSKSRRVAYGRKIAARRGNGVLRKVQETSKQQPVITDFTQGEFSLERKKIVVNLASEKNQRRKITERKKSPSAKRLVAVVQPAHHSKTITISLALDRLVNDKYFYSSSYSYYFPESTKGKLTSTIDEATDEIESHIAVKSVDESIVVTKEATANYNDSYILNTKVSCGLAADTPIPNTQTVEIHFTYEIDFNRTTKVVTIESDIFQSIADYFLNCNSYGNKRLLETTYGRRRRTQARRNLQVEQTFEFISLDRLPGDKLQRNASCIPENVTSNCRVIDGAMTVEINQVGEDAANKAKFEILSFIKASMDKDIYNSAESGITATRFIEPNLDTLNSTFTNSANGRIKYSDSTTTPDVTAKITPSKYPLLTYGLIAAGVLLISSIALFSAIQVKRTLENRDVASDMVASGNMDAERKETDTNTSSSILEEETGTTKYLDSAHANQYGHIHEGVHFLISTKRGYTELMDDSDILTQSNIPPRVCFDHPFLFNKTPPNIIASEKKDDQNGLEIIEK